MKANEINPVPYLTRLSLIPDEPRDPGSFPGNLPFVPGLDLMVESPVTFFVGENGSGKSTLLEAMAVLLGLPISGGGTNDTGGSSQISGELSDLAGMLRIAFTRRPDDRYFFRAEMHVGFAELLHRRRRDPDFMGDPFEAYGQRPLDTMSHGEAFLSVIRHRLRQGLFLLDEPESALSPQRQLALLMLMHQRVQAGRTQFFVATHSPILLTFPGATIISFDYGALRRIDLESTSHYQITRDLLNNPEVYWSQLTRE